MRLACASSLFFVATTAMAQAPAAPSSPWVFEAGALAVHQFDSGFSGGGDVGIDRVFAQGAATYVFDRRTSLGLTVSGGFFDYDFSGGATLGGGDPWGRIDELRLSLPVRFGVGESVDVIVIPSLRWNTESGATFDNGRTEAILAGAAYRVSPTLSIGPGVGMFSALDDDLNVFPILLLDWDVTDRINIGTAPGFGATQGPGGEVTYRLDGGWTLGFGARVENVQFRLDGDGPAPDGIGEFRTVPVFATATYAPTADITVAATFGVDVAGEATLRDRDGDRIESGDVDPAPFIGLSGRLRF